jgi:four helix bundle protein
MQEAGEERAKTYEEWLATVPDDLKRDSLWQFNIYPRAVFLYDLLWDDCEGLMKDVRGRAIAEQIIRSGGSISANIEEGFGRGFGAEFAYFLRVALGSARETRGWYYRARRLLRLEVLQHRLGLLDEIIGALVRASDHQKQQSKRQR